jgi:hypothetical protein
MFAAIRLYQGDPDSIDEAMRRVDEHFLPELTQEPWFVAYHCCDCGGGDICSVTICRDEEGARRSDELAAEFVRERLSDIELNRTEAKTGKIMVSEAAKEALEPAHV